MSPLPRLSPLDVVLEAIARIGQRREALLRSCGAPLAATALSSGAGSLMSGGAQVALQLTSVALLALCAAHVHRVLSPAVPAAPAQAGLGGVSLSLWVRYLLWLLTLVLALALGVTAPVSWVAEQAWAGTVPSEARLNVYLGLAFVVVAVGIYFTARLCLVLPAVALQQPDPVRLAWRCSRRSGVALAVLWLLPERMHWLLARAMGESGAARLTADVLEALVLVAIAALLSVAWSRLTEPATQLRGGLRGAWATAVLALPILLSHGWSQIESHRRLLELREETSVQARSGVASERQHEASLAVVGGDLTRGLRLYQEALQLYRDAGNPSGEARVLVLIGSLQRELGNEPAAQEAFASASERARASGDRGAEELVQKALSRPRKASP